VSEQDTLALRALALRLLSDRLKHADTANRDAIAAEYSVKDRKVVWLPLDGQDVEVGHVRRDKGIVTATVVGMTELIDWVQATYPGEVEEYQPAPVTRVRPGFLNRLLAMVKDNGAPVTDDGELIPGVTVQLGDPKTVVVSAKTIDAEAALVEQFRRDPYALQSLLQLPAGEPVD
jgi:hypothetical protein